MGSGRKTAVEATGTHSRRNKQGHHERPTMIASVCTCYAPIDDVLYNKYVAELEQNFHVLNTLLTVVA